VAITLAQYNDAAIALAKLGSQSLALLDVAPEQATAAAAYANVVSVSVKGSAAEVAAEFDSLSALGSQVDDIEITGDCPLMLTQDQVDNGQDTLDKIMGGQYDIQIVT
jgi:spore coat polysaccharide biosynthesis protein SpsF (cytidylyltransferase family)